MKKQKKISNIKKNEEINQIIKLEIYHENKAIIIKRDKNWQYWYKYHKNKV